MRTDTGVRTRTQRLWGMVIAVLLALAMAGAPPAGAQPPETEVNRIDGGATAPGDVRAIAISTCGVLLPDPGSADRVLLSRDDEFADALTASALAGDDGCILYTGAAPAGLDPAVRAEIDRVLPDGGQIELLGGVDALHPSVEGELVTDGYSVRRLEGATRYETAAAVAEVVRTEVPQTAFTEVILAWGDDWPDAVTAGAYAAAQGVPIVLTQTDSLHPAAARFLQDGPQVDRTSVIGGTAVISDQTAAAAPNAQRFAGLNRMGTAATIASSLWPTAGGSGIDVVAVNLELSDAWTTALTAAPLSAQRSAPQVGVAADRLPDETAAYLDSVGTEGLDRPMTVTVMGDQRFVSDAVGQQVADRLAGVDSGPARCDPADSDFPAEIPADAQRVEQIQADIDGNGQDDQLTTFLQSGPGGDFFGLHVLTTNGYSTIFLLDADEVADVRPLGTSIIGEGSPVAFVIEQAGAGTFNVAAIGMRDTGGTCELQRVTIPDDQAGPRYTVGSGNGLQCREVNGTPSLVVREARGEGPAATEFEWTEFAYTWPGAFELQFVDSFSGTFTSPEDDEQVQAFSTIDCPGVQSP